MPIDRKLWKSKIDADYLPNWPCPRCAATSLVLVKDSFRTRHDASTVANRGEPEFQEEFATGVFACLLVCSKPGCQEPCAVSGTYTTAFASNDHAEFTYESGTPKSMTPPPPLIQLPQGCPKLVREEVAAAFALFWVDHSSALNRIRNAIELLLTEMGVKRHGKKASGGRTRLPLDSRIAILKSKKPALVDLCDQLLAVKHLGNAGSHPGDVHIDDVFDGLDILQQVLIETYTKQTSVLAKMVKQINARKGPRRKEE